MTSITPDRIARYAEEPKKVVREILDEWDEEYRQIVEAMPDEVDLWEAFTEQCAHKPWSR